MPAAPLDLTESGCGYVEQGATYTINVQLFSDALHTAPLNITNKTFAAQIRKKHSSATGYDAVCTIINGALGTFQIQWPDTVTALIPTGETIEDAKSQGEWDCKMYEDGQPTIRVFDGAVQISPAATKEEV